MNLRIPGPTPCPPEVLAASSRQMINHRGPEFGAIMSRIEAGLKTVYATENAVLVLTAAGTGGLEAAVVNTLSPGDKVLSVSIGVFGDRFASIAETFGADVTRLSFDLGTAADPGAVDRAFAADSGYKAILLTHNETSTGVANPIAEIALAIRGRGDDRLLLIDAISSLSAIPLPVDELDLDVVVGGSQKGWMSPPGLAMASMSDRAWRAWEQARMPRFYFDLGRARDFAARGQTPWTPAISVLYALDTALRLMLTEGMDAIYARHRRIGDYTRKGLRRLGIELFADERFASDTVTAARVPDGVDAAALIRSLRDDHGVVVGGGQGGLAGRIFRIGHMGMVSEADIDGALAAIGASLPASFAAHAANHPD